MFIKNLLSTIFLTAILSNGFGQLKATPQCPEFQVNIMDGNVNGLKPNFTPGQIKLAFPCFTKEENETDSSKCGGLIAFEDKDIYFYTSRDYVEIKEKFKGKLSIPIMGAARNTLFKWVGYPTIKDVNWDAFQTAYGILVVHYNSASMVNLIQFSTNSAATLKLCE